MIEINIEACTGCGLCVRDCFARQLRTAEGKVEFKNRGCIGCGHCEAICPVGAIRLAGSRSEEIETLAGVMPAPDPEAYLHYLKARRSIRQFTKEVIAEDTMSRILETVRYSPTGANRQNVYVSVVEKQVPEFRELVIESLVEYGERIAEDETAPANERAYGPLWKKMEQELHGPKKQDRLFFEAPAVLVFSALYEPNAVIAAVHAETMIYALKMGAVFSGFTVMAALHSKEVREFLEIPEGHQPVSALVVGHPAVHYQRTVPRKDANVIWK